MELNFGPKKKLSSNLCEASNVNDFLGSSTMERWIVMFQTVFNFVERRLMYQISGKSWSLFCLCWCSYSTALPFCWYCAPCV